MTNLTPAEVAIRTMEAVERIAAALEDQADVETNTGYIGGMRPHLIEPATGQFPPGVSPLTESD